MQNIKFIVASWLAVLFGSTALGTPVQVGNRKQLFIDQTFIEQAKGVALHMNPPVKCGVVMRGTNAWENGVITGAGTVVEDGGKFRFWYTAMPASQQLLEHTQFRLCYAESTDGIRWYKPHLGLYEWEGSTDNNIIMNSEIESGGGVFVDPLALQALGEARGKERRPTAWVRAERHGHVPVHFSRRHPLDAQLRASISL